MMQKLSFALVLLVICQFANGQKILGGKCKTPTKVADFDVSRYVGHWYEYARYPHIFELLQKCSSAEYGFGEDNNVSVHNSAINEVTGKKTSIDGTAEVLGSGVLNVKFSAGFFPQSDKPNYYVADTDYETYSLVVACTDLPWSHLQFVWCLTREQFPSEETIAKCYSAMDANHIPLKYLHITNQKDCPAKA